MNATATVRSTNAIWILTLPVSPPYELIKIVTSGQSLSVKHDSLAFALGGILPSWDLLHLAAQDQGTGILTITLSPERGSCMIKYKRVTACPGRFVFEQGLGRIAFEAYVRARKAVLSRDRTPGVGRAGRGPAQGLGTVLDQEHGQRRVLGLCQRHGLADPRCRPRSGLGPRSRP